MTAVSRWLRLFAADAVATPVTIMAIALAGRQGHKVAALVAMGLIFTAGQTGGTWCLWRAYRAAGDPAHHR